MIINLCCTIRHPVVTTTVICVSLTLSVSLDDVNYIHIYTVKPERLRRYEGSNDLSDLLLWRPITYHLNKDFVDS
jgi:hypothetical protein